MPVWVTLFAYLECELLSLTYIAMTEVLSLPTHQESKLVKEKVTRLRELTCEQVLFLTCSTQTAVHLLCKAPLYYFSGLKERVYSSSNPCSTL